MNGVKVGDVINGQPLINTSKVFDFENFVLIIEIDSKWKINVYSFSTGMLKSMWFEMDYRLLCECGPNLNYNVKLSFIKLIRDYDQILSCFITSIVVMPQLLEKCLVQDEVQLTRRNVEFFRSASEPFDNLTLDPEGVRQDFGIRIIRI